MRMSERVGWSMSLHKQGSEFPCTCVLVFVCVHVVGGFCCFSTNFGFSTCGLCCYSCVSMETLSPIAALKTQHQSLCL